MFLHLPECGDCSQALVAAGVVLDGVNDEGQHISDVGAQPRPRHPGELACRGQHARHDAALSPTCMGSKAIRQQDLSCVNLQIQAYLLDCP